ncbi:MAG: hypothetical protein ACYTDX_01435 [Planctomycetota bacterium]|jgi:hypothetical protein
MAGKAMVAALLLAAGLSMAWTAAAQDAPGDDAGVDWRTDLDAARTEAAESGRPMLIVFR